MTTGCGDRVSLVAVVGPVETRQLEAFLAHYLNLGVRRCFLAFHFPEDTEDVIRARLHDTCRDMISEPVVISVGPWHEMTNPILTDQLRRAAGGGWHLLADVDEFQSYPAPLDNVISMAEAKGEGTVQGLLLDRVAKDGHLAAWPLGVDLDQAYPLGGFLTHHVLGGDPRKVVLARSGVEVASGNHWSPGRHATNDPVIPVHHFKWRDSVLQYLRTRVARLESGEWRETSPAPRLEARRFFEHYDSSGGRVNVQDPHLNFKSVSVNSLPAGWDSEARFVIDAWAQRPYPETAMEEIRRRRFLG